MVNSLITKFCELEETYDVGIEDIMFVYKGLCKQDGQLYSYSAGRLHKLEDYCQNNYEKRQKEVVKDGLT